MVRRKPDARHKVKEGLRSTRRVIADAAVFYGLPLPGAWQSTRSRKGESMAGTPCAFLHIPHSSKHIPAKYREQFVISDRALELKKASKLRKIKASRGKGR